MHRIFEVMKIVGALLMMLAINHIIGCCWFGIGSGSLGPNLRISEELPDVHGRCRCAVSRSGIWDGVRLRTSHVFGV